MPFCSVHIRYHPNQTRSMCTGTQVQYHLLCCFTHTSAPQGSLPTGRQSSRGKQQQKAGRLLHHSITSSQDHTIIVHGPPHPNTTLKQKTTQSLANIAAAKHRSFTVPTRCCTQQIHIKFASLRPTQWCRQPRRCFPTSACGRDAPRSLRSPKPLRVPSPCPVLPD